ncbi:PTS fructose-like transporter subunit EIIC [Candidatus Epulonipiscium fishelsonii]|uniref:PTS fructose-like transporter subunit EIIC n=1 Tax=Candidatus Epulonipiscium fishelsonii TaxID=77094 RepID=A0ACC8XCB3_9FIRM|nr:PTS fructose-like transporter subunit EIIC [Epulopiscium sp. SCG-B11WGA-EpuloA1]ONI43631.1 PTS fructose-like transporter subunit EIIC [Epulopiscium sp. SCG-B05WGA-EpuloA1]
MKELLGILKDTRRHLMSGVSYMIPFVVGGGILLALSVVFYGQGAVPDATTHQFLYELFNIGAKGFSLMIPIMAGYIGFSIADRPAIAPAAIGAAVGDAMGAGFLGGLVAGFLGGIVVYYLKKIKLPKSLKSLLTIIIIPVVGTFIVAGSMQWVLGGPIAAATLFLTDFLASLSSGSIVILAIVMGCMIAFDMGGPVNKVAYAFAIMSVSNGNYNIAGISAICVAIPSLAVGIATFMAPKKFKEEELEAGKAGFLMGLIGITEGAIPFAAADPLKVIPANMIGSAVGGSIAALLGVTTTVAWGGIIVLPASTNIIGFLIALAVGSIVAAVIMVSLKKEVAFEEEEDFDDDIELEIEFI